MKDYSKVAIGEAIYEEMISDFIDAIKMSDTKTAKNRLHYILMWNHTDITFTNVVGQFNSLIGHKTSADE